jgi:hypothetical protein
MQVAHCTRGQLHRYENIEGNSREIQTPALWNLFRCITTAPSHVVTQQYSPSASITLLYHSHRAKFCPVLKKVIALLFCLFRIFVCLKLRKLKLRKLRKVCAKYNMQDNQYYVLAETLTASQTLRTTAHYQHYIQQKPLSAKVSTYTQTVTLYDTNSST